VKIPKLVPVAAILVVLALWFVVTHVSAQQAKPNLTGTWKLNLNKSKLAPRHGPAGGDSYTIKHSEPRLEMEHMFSGRSEIYSYVTDGKERVANRSLQDGETRAKTYWDGDTLVIEKHQAGSFWVSRYTLSQDGKSLAVTHGVNKSSFSNAFDESLTYEKQR
jgi:hypothetical protein